MGLSCYDLILMLRCVVACFVELLCVMLCYVIMCFVILYYVILCLIWVKLCYFMV